MLDETQRAVIEVGEMAIERARVKSKQPRFSGNGVSDYADFYQSLYTWLKRSMDELTEQPYSVDNRTRDAWLAEFWKLEPHWTGCINQMVLLNSARPWSLVGGKTQVRRYANVLHNANEGKGWRHYFRQAATSYYTTDMGSVTEVGRMGRNGPLRAIWHVDSARTRWSGKLSRPLNYYPPAKARMEKWRVNDFFEVTSLPNTDEKFRGLGWCATSRAFQLVKLLYGVLMHDQETLGAKMMKGLLLLDGIEQQQWNEAMDARDAQMSERERKYFGGVYVLASLGGGNIDAKLVSLSQLPAGFDREAYVNQIMYAYSHILGIDPREFWPISSGQLGTARETEMMAIKAATKGTLEFPHAWQEKLQAELPESVHFEFEERDTDAEMMVAELAQVYAEVIQLLTEIDINKGKEPILTNREARSILVMKGLIPPEWTEAQEATVVSDEMYRMKFRALSEVQRCAEKFPADPIVLYRWDGISGTEKVLWERGDEALARRVF